MQAPIVLPIMLLLRTYVSLICVNALALCCTFVTCVPLIALLKAALMTVVIMGFMSLDD